jgi:hypothetical protein
VLHNPNAGIDTETAAMGVRLHGFSISAINVTPLHESSEQSPTNRLLHLGNKVCAERLGRVKLHALVGWFENAIDNADMEMNVFVQT